MKLISLLIFCIFIWSCNQSKCIRYSQKQRIDGVWSEHWIGAQSDVYDIDTVEIKIVMNKVIMTCLNDTNCIYDSIKINKNQFHFRLEYTTNPYERFFVYYKLQLAKNSRFIQGTILNSKNQTDTVRFIKERALNKCAKQIK